MKVTAELNNLRIAPRKVRLVADLIRGLDVSSANEQLDNTVKGSVEHVRKLLASAASNGENNFGLDKDNLYISEIIVGAGPMLKRWMPKAYGRAGQILKRTSNIRITLEERIEGKGRKTKEEMEKEKKKRMDERKKEEKARLEEKETREKEEAEKSTKDTTSANVKPTRGKMIKDKREDDATKKDGGKKSWGSKIFRRKSM